MWLPQAECDFHTQSVISTCTSVITPRTYVISTHTVWFWHARVSFQRTECSFYTQTGTSTRNSVISIRMRVVWHAWLWLPPEKCDFYTKNVIITRRVWFVHAEGVFHTQSVISTCSSIMTPHTNAISTHTVWFWRARVLFQHEIVWFPYVWVWFWHAWLKLPPAKCDFYTNSVIITRRVWFMHAEGVFHTQSVISTITSVIIPRTNVISKHTVWFWHARVLFQRTECGFYTQKWISIRNSVIFTTKWDFNM
jgi:hypothetical protein